MINCINSSNADSEMIANIIDLLQRDSNMKLKHLRNDKKYVISIINLLTQTLMLKKEKSKDYSWKKVTLKLIQHCSNDSEERNNRNQNAFITKNV